MALLANQAATAMPEANCAAAPAANTDANPEVCAEDAAGAHDSALRESLVTLSSHGLEPGNYAGKGSSARDAWLLAATHLHSGALDPESLSPRKEADPALAAGLDALPADADAAAFSAALDALAPASFLYTALQAELGAQTDASDPDASTAAGNARIASLRASLERLRWLPRENTERQIYANAPTFEVVAVSGETEVSRHTAIFGEIDRQTPEFSDSITYLEFSPWWNVPASMARTDKLNDFRNDPEEIEELRYKVLDSQGGAVNVANIDWDTVSATDFPYRLRQAPGPDNALGQVKIMFPNEHAVYLHDTPHTVLFSLEERALSAGCVRVDDVMALSEWILEDTPDWGRDQINAAINTDTETRATLAAPMSIHMVYLTAFPATDGVIIYAPDVYGLDAALLPALNGPPRKVADISGVDKTVGDKTVTDTNVLAGGRSEVD